MDIYEMARQTVAAGVPGVRAENVRIPARDASMSVYAPDAPVPAPDAFPALLGVSAVSLVQKRNGWLLFSWADKFYDACVYATRRTLDAPADDGGDYALSRMLLLARQGGEGCPRIPSVQRTLWQLLGAANGYTSSAEAGQAFLRMLYPLAPAKRMEARRECGALADACARLYAAALSHRAQNNLENRR